jgi:transposase
VLFVLRGSSTVEAARLLGDSQRVISEWMIQFRKSGIIALHDGEKSGRPAALNVAQKKALQAALNKTPSAVGLKGEAWTGLLVSEFLCKRYRIKFTMRHCRRLLRSFENSGGV